MFKFLLRLSLLSLLSSVLFAKDGLSQEHLLSLSPAQNAQDVRPKSLVKITFDREIVQRSVNKHTITLKLINPKGKKVKATVTISDKSTLVFTPNELLQEGEYRVKIKHIKLKANKDDYELSSFMKKVLYWLCSWFYDDISECPLYKKFYKVPSFIKTKKIHYSFNVVDKQEIRNPLMLTKVINGHILPPEPDPTLNNSTLLGIDVNNNGVRDDVERYLLLKYKDHHKIVSEIALQSGRAFQIVLAHPENARETTKLMAASMDCNWYFEGDADYYGDVILIDHSIMDYKFEDLQLNTKDRIRAYLEYNHNLSGGVYRLTPSSKRKAQCDFNVTELLKIK